MRAQFYYPHYDTIPAWVAVLVPLVMLALTVAVGELVASRRTHRSLTDAVAATMYFFLDGVQVSACGRSRGDCRECAGCCQLATLWSDAGND